MILQNKEHIAIYVTKPFNFDVFACSCYYRLTNILLQSFGAFRLGIMRIKQE